VSSEVAHSEEPAPPSVDRRIAHYVIQGRIGEGGMGVVYKALDSKLKRDVALKVLHPRVAEDEGRRKRFLREGRLVAHLTHPNIATVYDVGEADDRIFIAMELVEGEPLTSMIKPGRHVTVPEALRIIHEVARGLARAHEVGVIHRDLKPDNIMVGDDGIVKILDFGVAKRLDTFKLDFTDIKTQHGSLVGTPAYMSPEQAAGKKTVDERSDVFSLGVVLFELLTGKRPFEGDTWQETIIAINRDEPPVISSLRSDVPQGLDELVDTCLAKEPDARYASCREVIEDIEAILMAASTGTFPPGTSTGILARASWAPSSAPPAHSSAPPARISGEVSGVRSDRPASNRPIPASPVSGSSASGGPASGGPASGGPSSEGRTADPVAQTLIDSGVDLKSRSSKGWLWAGLALVVITVGALAYGTSGDETTAASSAEGDRSPSVDDGAGTVEDSADEPTDDLADDPATDGAEDAADDPATDTTAAEAAPSTSVTASGAPPKPAAPVTPPPAPKAGPKPSPRPLPKPKPKNPVLGF
jgi:serine/threonine-protein kinase